MVSNLNPNRRTVLKQSALLGAGLIGGSGVAAASSQSPQPVSGIIKHNRNNPITTNQIKALHDRLRKRFQKQYGRPLAIRVQPTSADNQILVAYAAIVGSDGVVHRYRGSVTESSSINNKSTTLSGGSRTTVDSETANRHNSANQFVNNGGQFRSSSQVTGPSAVTPQSTGSGAVTVSGAFNKFASALNEFGDCNGGRVIQHTRLYKNGQNDYYWALGTTTQIIPGVNTTCNTSGTNESGTAQHEWSRSGASNPVISSRDPTGYSSNHRSFSESITVSVGTDTSFSASLGSTYSQPDVYFQSSGSSVDTNLHWSYPDNEARTTTWETTYLSICNMRENLGNKWEIVGDSYNGKFYNGRLW